VTLAARGASAPSSRCSTRDGTSRLGLISLRRPT
jgi:hypothetical protein